MNTSPFRAEDRRTLNLAADATDDDALAVFRNNSTSHDDDANGSSENTIASTHDPRLALRELCKKIAVQKNISFTQALSLIKEDPAQKKLVARAVDFYRGRVSISRGPKRPKVGGRGKAEAMAARGVC